MNIRPRIGDSRGQYIVVTQDVVKVAHWIALSRERYSANYVMLMSPAVRSHIKINSIFVGLNSGISNYLRNTKVCHELSSPRPILLSLCQSKTGKKKHWCRPCYGPLGGLL